MKNKSKKKRENREKDNLKVETNGLGNEYVLETNVMETNYRNYRNLKEIDFFFSENNRQECARIRSNNNKE